MGASGSGVCVDLPIIYPVIHVRDEQGFGSVRPLPIHSYLYSLQLSLIMWMDVELKLKSNFLLGCFSYGSIKSIPQF